MHACNVRQDGPGRANRAFFAACCLLLASAISAQASPITYQAAVMTDVSLGGVKYHNADVTITFHGDTADIQPFSVTAADGNTGSGVMISKGTATVTVATATRHVSARFAPGQLFVSTDSNNCGMGVGSLTGPNGLEPAYPLAFTDGTAGDFSCGNDLSTEISLSGKAWSCIGYPPTYGTGTCSNPEAYPLKTDKGPLVIYQPYLFLDGSGTGAIMSDYSGTMSRGTFSIVDH